MPVSVVHVSKPNGHVAHSPSNLIRTTRLTLSFSFLHACHAGYKLRDWSHISLPPITILHKGITECKRHILTSQVSKAKISNKTTACSAFEYRDGKRKNLARRFSQTGFERSEVQTLMMLQYSADKL